MAERFAALEDRHIEFIGEQQMFFVGTAAAEGHVNVSPNSPSAIAHLVSSPLRSRTLLGVPTGRQLLPVARAVAEDRIKVIVSKEYPLAEIDAAFEQSKSGRTVGKIVLIP